MTIDPRCFFCNIDLVPTEVHMNSDYYFCGGEPVCVCGDTDPDDHTHDTDRLADDGNPHIDDDEYEFNQAHSMPAWMCS
jgi:hypothetical protein